MIAYRKIAKTLLSGHSMTTNAISAQTGVVNGADVVKYLKVKGMPVRTERVGQFVTYSLDKTQLTTNRHVLSKLIAGQTLTAEMIALSHGIANPYNVISALVKAGHPVKRVLSGGVDSKGRAVVAWKM